MSESQFTEGRLINGDGPLEGHAHTHANATHTHACAHKMSLSMLGNSLDRVLR